MTTKTAEELLDCHGGASSFEPCGACITCLVKIAAASDVRAEILSGTMFDVEQWLDLTVRLRESGMTGSDVTAGAKKTLEDVRAARRRAADEKPAKQKISDVQDKLVQMTLMRNRAEMEAQAVWKQNEALKRALIERACSLHFGEQGEDYPTASHQHLGKHGWETVKCGLSDEERKAIGER